MSAAAESKRAVDPSVTEYLRARAFVARVLVREKELTPEDALMFVVWPTDKVVAAERRVNRHTLAARAFSNRLNE